MFKKYLVGTKRYISRKTVDNKLKFDFFIYSFNIANEQLIRLYVLLLTSFIQDINLNDD